MRLTDQWPGIDPGELRHRITFLSQSLVGPIGPSGTEEKWFTSSPPLVKRAKIQYLNARDKVANGQDIGQVLAEFTIRYDRAITSQMRLQTANQYPNGGYWVIEEMINPGEMNLWLVMTCSQLGADRATA